MEREPRFDGLQEGTTAEIVGTTTAFHSLSELVDLKCPKVSRRRRCAGLELSDDTPVMPQERRQSDGLFIVQKGGSPSHSLCRKAIDVKRSANHTAPSFAGMWELRPSLGGEHF